MPSLWSSFLIKVLKNEGFIIKYTYPNLIFILWEHIPSEIKKNVLSVTSNEDNDNNKNKKDFRVNIVECPLASEGLFKRVYLIIWAYFHQGDVNHILGDINFISLLMKKEKTINTFLDCRLLDEFKGLKKIVYKLFWFSLPVKKSNIITFISNFTKREIEKK